MKRILFYIERYAPITGGAEISAHRLAKALKNKGYEIKVMTRMWDPNSPRFDEKDGIPIERIPCFFTKSERIRQLEFFVKSWLLFKYFKEYDVLHMHGVGLFSGLLAKAFKPQMSIIKTTTADDVKNVASYPLIGGFCIRTLRHINHFVCMSKELKKEVKEYLPEADVVMIPNGVDTEEFKR
jgi:glycosyltransferase involved in cell wall biosynthesis